MKFVNHVWNICKIFIEGHQGESFSTLFYIEHKLIFIFIFILFNIISINKTELNIIRV